MSSKPNKHIAIAGAGVLSLATAYVLTEHGYKVTIIARNLSGDAGSTDWASPWAGALLAPHPDIPHHDLQLKSLEMYQYLADTVPESGVTNSPITEFYTDRPSNSPIWYSHHMRSFTLLPPSSIPSNASLGYTYTGLLCNPAIFLPWISFTLTNRGVHFIRHTLNSLMEIHNLVPDKIDVVINATGLGAKYLASDARVQSARGQTMSVRCSPDSPLMRHAMLLQGSEYTYVIPRVGSGGVIIGGVSQYGDERKVPDVTLRADILGRVNKMTGGAFEWVDLEGEGVQDIVGFRPGREGGLRVEREGNVVHAYGAASWGYVYAFGVAERVRELVEGKVKAHL